MPSRKRTSEVQSDERPNESPLKRIRGMWQFANLCQWIYTFGKAAKIDESIDIEEIEAACLTPDSTLLLDIALALLKLISSHRGLTHDIFDSQARKQYLDKAPVLNPFGTHEIPLRFQDFDVVTKIRILQQMTQWTMIHPERIRDKMDEQKDAEQTSWRIEPYGWDSEDRTYFVLDDNRVYRLTEAPPAPLPRPKKKKTVRTGRRSSKRRRTDLGSEDQDDEAQEPENTSGTQEDGLGGMTWECLAVTLDEVRTLLDEFRKTRDENEKILRTQLQDHLVPVLEKQEESRKRKAQQRERELLNLAKMANAKRSSRIANKIEQQKQDEKSREDMQQHREAEEAKRREDEARLKREQERDFRLASREQRLKEREARRLRHEEELAQLSEDSRRMDDGNGRVSERRLQLEIEKNRQALKDLDDEDEDWIFDCVCGLHGQIDDGTHSVACEKCNVWQHSKCLGISEEEAERPEFHFICRACLHREESIKEHRRPTIKLKVNRPVSPNAHSNTSERSTRPEASISALDAEPPSGDHGASHPHEDLKPRLQAATQQQSPPIGLAEPTHNKEPRGSAVDETTSASLTETPSAMLGQLQAPASTHESTLSTPAISRDIYRATHIENGNLPAQGGLSPTKHSPQSSFASVKTSTSNTTPAKIPPGITLSPTLKEPILTPPTKQPEPARPQGHQ